MSLSPPPSREKLPITTEGGRQVAEMPRAWIKWFTDLKELLAPVSTGGLLLWTAISKAGSNLTDLTVRNHADLQNVNSSTYTHLTELDHTDLTDGGTTILHKHTHNLEDGLQGGTTDEYYHNTAHEDALTDIIDTQLSTGVLGAGGIITDGGSGTINIASRSVLIRATNSDTADIAQYTVAAITGQALTNLVDSFVYAEYNAGVPQYVVSLTERTDTNTNILIGKVYRSGTAVHIFNESVVRANDNLRRLSRRFVETIPFQRVEGAILSETGTRNISCTAGIWWECSNRFTTSALNTAVSGSFTNIYSDGAGGWTEQLTQTQIDNTYYDNGTGTPAAATTNHYLVRWIYIESDSDIVVRYGTGDHVLEANANAEAEPTRPHRIDATGRLIGKVVIRKGDAVFTSIQNAFDPSFEFVAPNNHNALSTLQGGAAGEYFHFTDAQHTDLTDGGQSSLHGHPDTLINIQTLGVVTDNVTLNDTLSHSWSAGTVTGFALTDNGNGTINLAVGEAMIRPTANEHDSLISCQVGATTNLALTNNSLNYVYVNYNTGTPIVQAGTSLSDFNCLDKCLIYTISREGTTLYWVHAGEQNIDFNRKHRRMLLECEGFRHVHGGCVLSATGTRNISVSAGGFYYGLAKITHTAFDTSVADTFKYYYRDGIGGWTTTTGNTQISNTQYDNGTGALATISNNKLGVFLVYLILDNPTILAVQFGQGDYANIEDAKSAPIPTAPPTIQGVGVLIGRIIIEKSAAAFSEVASSFTETFVASSATSHSGLSGLQGGTVGEYYHLTSAQATDLTDAGDSALHYHSADRALANITGLAANVATFLATPSSANLAAAVTDGTGTGALVFAEKPQFTSTIGIGVAATSNVGIRSTSALALSGSTVQIGAQMQPTFGSDCTLGGSVFYASPSTTAAAYTMPFIRNFTAAGFALGAGSTVTTYVGFYSIAETNAGTHYSFQGDQTAVNASDRNCYMFGAAPNYFNGAVMIGSNTDDGVNKLQVNGGAVSKHATAGIGYATGAGGTVTQATSKATGVTLNKVTGNITMNNAALAAESIVSFVLTNSSIAATDYLDVQHISGGTLGEYHTQASCAAGSATIYVKNTSAGSLSEAIVLKFYLNKAVIA